MFTLVIPTLTGHRRVCQVLNSAVTSHPFRVCIVDNALAQRCVAASWNLGIRTAFETHGSRYAIVANDDVLFHPACLDELVSVAEAYQEFVNGQLLADPDDLSTRYTQGGFSLFLITPACIRKVGWFDEAFVPAYYEDTDYFYRMKLAGVSEFTSPDAGFYHHRVRAADGVHVGAVTVNEVPELRAQHKERMRRNLEYYKAKWGGAPGSEPWTQPFNGKAPHGPGH